MHTGPGAALANGYTPHWMQDPPWYDPCAAADTAQNTARLPLLLAERFGDPDDWTRESTHLDPAALTDDDLSCRRRRIVLCTAIDGPPSTSRRRVAA